MKTLTFNNGTVSVGDVFVSSWGYEQTNYKTPLLNDFCGEPLKRRVRDYYSTPAIEIEEFETAYKGSPEEKHEFTSYY
ncbi:hypothetical protein Q6M75_004361 [Salmonella enterica]|nr:hypothetical protein [Salmonella enterica]